MQVLECSGTPYEVGCQHGQALAGLVQQCHSVYCRFPGMSAEDVDWAVDALEGAHQARAPESLAELRGVADGAGMPYREVLRLNFCMDIAPGDSERCSVIGVPDSADGPLIAKTVDLQADERAFLFIQKVTPKMGPAYLHYVSAGTVWTEAGLTAAGLAYVMAALPGRRRRAGGLSAFTLITMGQLSRCGAVSQALDWLRQYDIALQGMTLLLADAGGDMAMVEILPGSWAERRVERGERDVLWHTNHAVCPETLDAAADAKVAAAYGHPGLIENSRTRYDRLNQLAPHVDRSRAGLERVLRDHVVPGAICQHGAAGMHSSAGIVISPRQRIMWGTMDYPCQSEFPAFVL
jgi:Acyl-coenzyme A:6-aminopenicillanic acid acyl-transferase